MPRKSKSAAAAASTAAEAEESQQSTQDLSQGMTTDEPADTQDSALDYDDSQTQEAEATEQGEDEEEAAKKTGGAGSKKEKHRAGKAKKKKADEEICTERDVLERIPLPAADERAGGGVKSFTVLAWNVNGLRATVKNGLDALRKMVDTEKPDLVCFQETKLQEKDVDSVREQDILPGYDSAWTCSTDKKGYAGQAVFFPRQLEPWEGAGDEKREPDGPPAKKQKQAKMSSFFAPKEPKKSEPAAAPAAAAPSLAGGRSGQRVLGVRFGIGDAEHDGQGRSITVEYEKFFVLTLYVPNSGMKLERLSYRTEKWDPALRKYVEKLEGEGKPVVVTGDLNVAHLDIDIYNSKAPHIKKTAGTTNEERESFDSWLKEGKMVDAFRRLHPEAKGAYTYWSVRTGARPFNKGLRLDYFLCSKALFAEDSAPDAAAAPSPQEDTAAAASAAQKGKKRKERQGNGKKKAPAAAGVVVHDCFQLDKATVGLSDHCPVGIVLRIV